MSALQKTPSRYPQDDVMEYYAESAKVGIRFIRSLYDGEVLDAARDETSATHSEICVRLGPCTNHSWVTMQAAHEAYDRGLINEDEWRRLTDD